MPARAFVIGHPISHSRSPLIHSTWITSYGLSGSYEAIDLPPEDLETFIDSLRRGQWRGGNVTVPHKQSVFALCDEVDPLARRVGAVNTLICRGNGSVFGTNTDYQGFLNNLDADAPGWSKGLDRAIVLGAGGAARAVLVALIERGIGAIDLLNRSPVKAHALAQALGNAIRPAGLDAFATVAPHARLLVNTSSIGMHGTRFDNLDLRLLSPDALVTDIVYTPLITPLLAEARILGLRTVDGLGMLLHQAAPGFESWFGIRPEVTPELRLALEATL